MKRLFLIVTPLIIILLVFVSIRITTEVVRIKGYYNLTACEGCYFFKVVNSTDKDLIGKIIFLKGNKDDIESLAVQSTEAMDRLVCFQASKYLLNIPVDFIDDPNAMRMKYVSRLELNDCVKM